MQASVKAARLAVLFLLFSVPVFIGADVKLRIYLKNGTLQAGNLVAENKESFVILTKEGRAEIPKTDIMFVNGKTLAQWDARPDKTYSTEIFPENVPNPAFINEKMALPPPVALPPAKKVVVAAVPVSAPAAVEPPEPMEPLEAEAPEPQKKPEPTPVPTVKAAPKVEPPVVSAPVVAATPAPAVQPTAVVPAPADPVEAKPVVVAKKTRPAKKKTVPPPPSPPEPVRAEELPEPVRAAKPSEPPAKPTEPVVERPGKFERESYSLYHYNLALQYLQKGDKGHAAQELHIASTLNKWHEETALALGRHYMEQGVYPRARKYLDLPTLRKKPDVKAMVLEIDHLEKRNRQRPWIWRGVSGAGVLLSIGSIFLLRLLKKKPVASLVVTSENIDEIADRLEVSVKQPPPVEPEPEIPEPVVLAPPPPPPPLPMPDLPKKPLEEIIPLRVFMPEPRPISQQPPIVRGPEVPLVEPEPVKPEPPVLIPVPAPLFSEQNLERERVLEIGRIVAESVQKGNALAAEGSLEAARREYRTAAALDPQSVDAQLGLAYLYFVQDQWELTLQHYVRAIEISPACAEAHYGLGRVLYETNRLDQAVPELRRSLELDPTLHDARETLTELGLTV